MDIFNKIESLAKKGYSIEFISVDQHDNGMDKDISKGLIPAITYTINVIRLSDSESIYTESFNHIKEGLLTGIKFTENIIPANSGDTP